jgi:VWFA-related protein
MLGLALTAALLVVTASHRTQQKPTAPSGVVHEQVNVERVIVAGRVIDRYANPILGLTTSDFRVLVDGKETGIETVDWVPWQRTPAASQSATAQSTQSPRNTAEIAGPAADTGAARTLVMLFQWELAGQKDVGFVRMMRQAERMIEATNPEDRIAILAFGSSLRLLQDFTNDHGALRDAIEAIRSLNHRGRASDGLSLASGISECRSRDSIQKAIVCLSSALEPLPGPKTLLFFGWTIGRQSLYDRYRDYPLLIDAISKARTSVFVLDVSDGHHTLAPGLQQLAADTGGLYNGGCIYEMRYCADLARAKTQQAIDAGTYELVFRDPSGSNGWHEIQVQLRDSKGIPVFARWYRN